MLQRNLTINLSMLGKNQTGLGVYALNCTAQLTKRIKCRLIASNDFNIDDAQLIKSPIDITLGFSKYASLKRLYYSAFQFPVDNGLIYTPTHHGILGYKNQVLTIHDLICIHHSEQHKLQYWYFKYVLPYLIKDCKALITVSQTTKMDICKYFKVSEDFVHVIPNAIHEKKIHLTKKNKSEEKYLLSVGAAYQHKNIHELLVNSDLWAHKYKLKVVSANGSYLDYLQNIVKEQNIEDKVQFYGYVSEEKLQGFYCNCSALVYPSLWEGFGIPPLEAFGFGKPVILSNIPVFKEIFATSAIYIDIGNRISWEKAFRILEDKNIVKEKICQSKDILAKYNWEKNGNELLKLLIGIDPRLKTDLR